MRNAMWVGGGITGMGEIPMLGVKEKGIAKVIRDIFRNGEQGFFYDPRDLNTQYQDAAGTATVNTTGQPLGLVLDKSKSLVLGPELVTVATPFNIFRDATASTPSPALASLQANTAYIVSITVSSVRGTIGADFRIKWGSTNLVATTSIGTVIGTFTCILIPKITELLTIVGTSNGTDFTVSGISVKEIKGNHAYQTTSAARPLFRQIEILGTELATNGSLTSDLSGWSPSAPTATTYIDPIKGAVRDVPTATQYPTAISRIFDIKEGATYRITAEIFGSQTAPAKVLARKVNHTTVTAQTTSVAVTSPTPTKVSFTTVGTSTQKLYLAVVADTTNVIGSFGVRNISVKEITGYHTDKNYLEYDGVDDKLLTNLPVPLTNATVLRAVPGVGTEVKYNQTLPMLYEDSSNHSGLVAIDRALTYKEQLRIMNELDRRAGAVGYDTTVFKLFDPTQQGFWYDPNDLSTMYQDAAGTIPVTGVGQPVGLIRDKSGRNNHAYQIVSASRPILSDRVNVFDNSTPVITGGTWSVLRTAISYPSMQTPNGLKTVALVTRTEAGNGYVSYKPVAILASLERTLVFSAIVKASGSAYANLRLSEVYPTRVDARFDLAAGVVHSVTHSGALFTNAKAEIKSLGDGWYYIAVSSKSAPSSANTCFISFSSVPIPIDGNEPTTTAAGYIYGADLRVYSAGSPVTLPLTQEVESGITKTKGFPNYLYFDGVDDFLQTNNIDFTATDELSLFAGVRKLSDATSAIVAEFSAVSDQKNGAFSLLAPGAGGVNKFATINRGTTASFSFTKDLMYSAPYSAVLTAHNYIPLKTALSVNRIALNDGGGVGTGNYGNYPLYIGRRGGTTLPFNGHIYGLIGIGKLTSDNETVAIEKELAKRTGVTLNV